jgi:hypothetical protein
MTYWQGRLLQQILGYGYLPRAYYGSGSRKNLRHYTGRQNRKCRQAGLRDFSTDIERPLPPVKIRSELFVELVHKGNPFTDYLIS